MTSRGCRRSTATNPSARALSANPTEFFHIDIAEVQTVEGQLYLFVAIDRSGMFAIAQFVETVDKNTASEFLQRVVEEVPYQIHTILTANDI
jgi:hypothetical protein